MSSEPENKSKEQEITNKLPDPIFPITLQPFNIQLQNIVPIEMHAVRFPVDLIGNADVQINMIGLDVNVENLLCQSIWEIKVASSQEPHSFEISFKMLAVFVYEKTYSTGMVSRFLQEGGLSIVLPFARELLVSICVRLQIPPIMLALVQLANPLVSKEESNSSPEE